MTTICASRLHGEMAADTQVNFGSSTFPSKKIFSTPHGLVGAAGTSIDCAKFVAWVEAGMNLNDRDELKDEDEFQALLLTHEGLFFFEGDWVACRIERDYHAIGTGGEAALAALMCGKNPRRAVEIAAKIDSGTGGPVTVLTLEG
jgi:ATP-dependent protease HslVU (ClpYQ) peptidase subunit